MYSNTPATIPAYGARHDHYLHLVEAFGAFALLSLILREPNPGKAIGELAAGVGMLLGALVGVGLFVQLWSISPALVGLAVVGTYLINQRCVSTKLKQSVAAELSSRSYYLNQLARVATPQELAIVTDLWDTDEVFFPPKPQHLRSKPVGLLRSQRSTRPKQTSGAAACCVDARPPMAIAANDPPTSTSPPLPSSSPPNVTASPSQLAHERLTLSLAHRPSHTSRRPAIRPSGDDETVGNSTVHRSAQVPRTFAITLRTFKLSCRTSGVRRIACNALPAVNSSLQSSEVRMKRQPVRRIEFNNKDEYAIFVDRGCAVEPAVSYPTLQAAESSLSYFLDTTEADTARTYKILTRPTPKCWKVLPPDSEGWTSLPPWSGR